jgi:hypothetical protein
MKVTMFPNTLTRLALTGTAFEPLRPLFRASSLVIHSPDVNVKALSDLVKKHPRVVCVFWGVGEGRGSDGGMGFLGEVGSLAVFLFGLSKKCLWFGVRPQDSSYS